MKSIKLLISLGLSLSLFATSINAASLTDMQSVSLDRAISQNAVSENISVSSSETLESFNSLISENETIVSEKLSESTVINESEEAAEAVTSQITVTGGTEGVDYIKASDGTLTVKTSTPLILDGNGNKITNEKIVLGSIDGSTSDINVTFKDLIIDCNLNDAAVKIPNNYKGNVNITIEGNNELKSHTGAGIMKNSDSTDGVLTIDGNGSLKVIGNTAGIGGGYNKSSSNIVINGGIIDAHGGIGACIGGGEDEGNGTNITINGGYITARNGSLSGGPAIGGAAYGYGENISITGGVVIAEGSLHTAAIGGGRGHSGSGRNISITGGVVTAITSGGGAAIGGGQYGEASNIFIRNASVKTEYSKNGRAIGSGGTESTTCDILDREGGRKVYPIAIPHFGEKKIYYKTHDINIWSTMYFASHHEDDDLFHLWLPEGIYDFRVGDKQWVSIPVNRGNVNVSTKRILLDEIVGSRLEIVSDSQYKVDDIVYNCAGANDQFVIEQISKETLKNKHIVVSGETEIAIKNLNIESFEDYPAMLVNSKTLIKAEGTNIFTSPYRCAGIEHPARNGMMTLSGNGTIIANGGSGGAGIGGGWSREGNYDKNATGNTSGIVCAGCNIVAIGGSNAAGIGGGEYGSGSYIEIKAGNITAKGGSSGAGIGGGTGSNGTNIIINGGYIIAYSKYSAAGIGGGYKGDGTDIYINGGNVDSGSIGSGEGGKNTNCYITGGNVKGNVTKGAKKSANDDDNLVQVKISGYVSGDAIPFDTIEGAEYYNIDNIVALEDGCFYLYLPEGISVESYSRYRITFVSNGDTDVPSQLIYSGKKIEKPLNAKKAGYVVEGWYKHKSHRTAEYKWDFENDIVENDMTLYANWEVAYTVEFKTGCNALVQNQLVKHGGKINKPIDPIREGYTFKGWCKTSALTEDNLWDFDNDIVTGNVTLYAVWSQNSGTQIKYTVSFNTGCELVISSQNIVEREKIARPEDPVREGYTFKGWYKTSTSMDDSNKWDFDKDVITENIILYAGWIKKGETDDPSADIIYVVTFMNGDVEYKKEEVKKGASLVEPTDKPLKTGYEFVGWANGTSLWNFSVPVNKNLILTAKFIKLDAPADDNQGSGMDCIPIVVSSNEITYIYLVKGQKYETGIEGLELTQNNGKTIKVTKKGRIVATRKGSAILEKAGKKYNVFVAEPYIDIKKVTVLVGNTAELKLNLNTYDGQDGGNNYPVTWYSANPKVATVNNGTVTAIAKGSTKVSAYVGGKAYTSIVKVTDTYTAPKSIESTATIEMIPLQSFKLKYKSSIFKVNSAVWTGDGMTATLNKKTNKPNGGYANSIVSITKAGNIKAIGEGSTTITGTNNGKTVTLTVKVSPVATKEVTYITKEKSETIKFPKVNNKKATDWKISDTSIVTLITSGKKSGKVTGSKCGSTDISCSYNGFKFTTKVYVEDPVRKFDGKEITGNTPIEVAVGDIKKYEICNVYQTVNYKSSKPAVAFVDENGYVYARKNGKAVISTKINGKTYKITVKVRKSL